MYLNFLVLVLPKKDNSLRLACLTDFALLI